MAKQKKAMDFEVDLIAVSSVLAVQICAMLLTAVWIHLGTMNVKQAVGGQSQAETKKVPALWAKMGAGGTITFRLQDIASAPKNLQVVDVAGVNNEFNLAGIAAHVEAIRKIAPDLRTVLIQPDGDSMYEKIIQLMDHFKSVGMIDLGVAPL
ncbi:MAG: biopolymer transporter ExbD [Bdellovibrionales bacterium]|nr:biopolymer transporter ExbD [Bdellovibrionales bacterium]